MLRSGNTNNSRLSSVKSRLSSSAGVRMDSMNACWENCPLQLYTPASIFAFMVVLVWKPIESRSTSAYLVLILNLPSAPRHDEAAEPPVVRRRSASDSGGAGKVTDTVCLASTTGKMSRKTLNLCAASRTGPPGPAKTCIPSGSVAPSLRCPNLSFDQRSSTSRSLFCELMATFHTGKLRPGIDTEIARSTKLIRCFLPREKLSAEDFLNKARGRGVWSPPASSGSSRTTASFEGVILPKLIACGDGVELINDNTEPSSPPS
mmetsp:Transcript_72200/g.209010  ORF Transcript_72200/g.209010 Transcript_72200/m.209010 type:complete len:262 (-) Transcript_72200:382-1167(-)